MGGCVVSVMDRKNTSALEPAEAFVKRSTYGPINVKFTEDETDRSGIYRRARLSDEEHAKICKEWYYQQNLLQTLQKNCETRKDKQAIAYRTIDKISKEKKVDEKGVEKEWEYIHLNDPTYITYSEFWELLTAFGKGLAELGLKTGDKVAIYEETRWEWLTTMMGLWTQEMVGVTVYANLGQEALIYALEEAACGAVVCNGRNVPKLMSMMKKAEVETATIIYLDDLPSGTDTGDFKVIRWTEVLEMGKRSSKPYSVVDNNDTVVLIMYTSGTTGNPKGVIHSIGALTQGARGLGTHLNDLIGHTDNETYVSYLPAAHIFEFICENIFLARGILLCFGSPRTLTDTFARPCGDITQFKPFFLIGVPRILETIKKTVESRLPPPGTLKRRIFEHAYQSRLQSLRDGKETPYWNEKVFQLPRSLMGPNMRGICSGGAPLADRTQEWINVVLGVPVAQGYGMTETVCNAAVQRTGELTCIAGQFLHGVEACLLDTEEYKHTDKPNQRGELLLRGSFMFKGYFAQPQQTADALIEDGWMRTGDVAEIDATDGNVKIIGRVKALAKNVLGEYIALESLEALYSTHPMVNPNGLCIVVDVQKAYIAALVLTDESKAMKFAAANKIGGSWPDVLKNSEFRKALVNDLAAIGKAEGKMNFEFIKNVCVLSDEWTPENNLVTASLKVRRTEIDKHYAKEIAELFKE